MIDINQLAVKRMAGPLAGAFALAGLPVVTWRTVGRMSPAFFAAYVALATGIGVTLYLIRPRGDRLPARRLALFLLGTGLFAFAALRDPEAKLFQIEGLWFDMLAGVWHAAVLHYVLAKVAGPLVFGRAWCGWACWTVALLDQLPFKRSRGRLPGRWSMLRYVHFGLSLLLVTTLVYGFDYRPGADGHLALAWFVVGNLLYYLVGIVLAFALKDNRAFCKYICPVAVPLKLSARFALLKVAGNADRCDEEGLCIKSCPMDIRITEYVKQGQRVLSTECILCQQCINVCPNDALRLAFGFDHDAAELLVERKP